jgi:hypothetical protein
MRSIRLVVVASSSVLSADDETKMNVKKHECSLLEVFSDVGSTPTASTITKIFRNEPPAKVALSFVGKNVSNALVTSPN